MNFKKIFLIAALTGVMANTALAAQGDTSIIPQIKYGSGEADAGSIWGEDLGDEDIDAIGVSADFLYEVQDNVEIGLGIGIDKNKFDESDELDFTSYSFYGVGRYNFANVSSEAVPYVALKAGYKSGDESFTEVDSGETVKVDIETDLFYSLALGLEYNNFNVEVGYEHTEADLDASYSDGAISLSGSTDVDINIIFVSAGYRFEL